jgi:integrase
VFVLALVYGLRWGEIAGVMWEDIDFTNGRIHVRSTLVRVDGRLVRGPAKTAAGIRVLPLVPLTHNALYAVRDWQTDQRLNVEGDWQDTGYVFTTRTGRPVEPRNLSRSFDRVVASAGLPGIVFHDLRRTTATLLKSLGVPARDAQTILGLANITVALAGLKRRSRHDRVNCRVGGSTFLLRVRPRGGRSGRGRGRRSGRRGRRRAAGMGWAGRGR